MFISDFQLRDTLIPVHLEFREDIFQLDDLFALDDIVLDNGLLLLDQVVSQPLDLFVLLLLLMQEFLMCGVALLLCLEFLLCG